MDVHSPSSRAGAAAAVTALLLCTSLAAADAASSAQTTSTTAAVTSGSWGAIATTATAAPYGTGPLTLTFSGLLSAPQYFNLVNTGTLPLTAVTVEATTTRGGAVIEACSTTWNELLGTCSSVLPVTVATSGAGPTAYTVLLPAGSSIRLRASVTNSRNFAMTIGVKVSRAQVRAATTTGS